MTTLNDPRILDRTAFGRHSRKPRDNGGDLHALRLALDLQLDALLLALAAAAAPPDESLENPDGVPWRRWLVEDLDAARSLGAAILNGEGGSLPGMAGALRCTGRSAALEQLVAHYSSMEGLLSEALDRPHRGQPWRQVAGDTLLRCRARLEELHAHRREAFAAGASRPEFLPGELLG
ncbi:MAG TPA: hypothetical protein VI248_19335 [Kineosporiaceae bacterium]